MTRRNPFVVLGIPYGTKAATALRYFVRRRREIRSRGDDSPYTLNDLNAAHKRVEEVEADPQAALDIFRVPANPQAFRPRSGYGLLHPAPRPLPPEPVGLDPTEVEGLRQAALRELVIDILTSHGHLLSLPTTDLPTTTPPPTTPPTTHLPQTNRRPDAGDTKPTG